MWKVFRIIVAVKDKHSDEVFEQLNKMLAELYSRYGAVVDVKVCERKYPPVLIPEL